MTAAIKQARTSNFWSRLSEGHLLPLHKYKKIVVALSGGKDSIAAVLMLLDMGIKKEQIELWHHLIDGAPGVLGNFDWPITEDYVRAFASAIGIPLRFSWKAGGFERELFRENTQTSGVFFEDGNRKVVFLPPEKPIAYCKECRIYFEDDTQAFCPDCNTPRYGFSTRLKYPMVTADLNKRWCSAYLKIMVCRRVIGNDPRFKDGNFLLITGERRQESDARAEYDEAEEHYTTNKKRRVDQWRGIIDWREEDVWAIMERHRIQPHPAYRLGWGRVSCMCCIFGDRHQWSSIRHIAPKQFNWHADNERRFSLTIKQNESVVEMADRGDNFVKEAPQWLIDLALSQEYPRDKIVVPANEKWVLPAGAYKRCGGPS